MAVIDIQGNTVGLQSPGNPTNPNADLAWKAPARVGTTGSNITLSGQQTIDDIALSVGDRVLVKDQTDQTTNGLYNVQTGPWTRTIDANNNSQLTQGMQVMVTAGLVNADKPFVLTTANPVIIGTSNITFQGSFLSTLTAATFSISVSDFAGIDPTGTNDSTTAIQNAINSLPASGGNVIFPPGNYKVSSTITLGNGTSSAVSTIYGIKLIGTGMPVEPIGFAGYPSASGACVRIFWAGASGGTVMEVAGPLQGWGIENILIDGNSSANRGLDVISAQYGDVRNLVIVGCMTWGLYSETVAPFGSVTFTGSAHNRYDNLTVQVPVSAVGGGIVLTSAGSTSNTLFNVFTNTTIAIFGSTQNGIYLQAAAGNVFVGVHISGSVGDTSITFDYNINSDWPANNTLIGVEPVVSSTVAANVGSPGTGARPNYLYNLITTDGAAYPALANLVTDAGQLYGTQTSDNANAGNVGEHISSTVTQGSAVSMTNSTVANVTSIPLTPGDWEVWFQANFNPAAGTSITFLEAAISTTSSSVVFQPGHGATLAMPAGTPANPMTVLAGPARLSLGGSATYYANVEGLFSVSTLAAYGILQAWRRR